MTASRRLALQSRAALWMAGLAAVIGGLWLMLDFWPGGLPYDTTSGVWSALADDLAHGELYRPVLGETGYGGTRYMPLFFSLHGGLISLGLSTTTAGLLLTLVSIGLLAAGTYRLMRAFGAKATPAALCVCLLPASIAFQLLTISIKGDLFAVGLGVWGLAWAVAWDRGPTWIRGGVAVLLFAAAVLTKFTAVFALASMLMWLGRERRWKRGLALAAGAGATVLAGLTATYALSDGRILESFAACATGGAQAGYAWKFPFWFACVVVQDPFFCALLIAGGIAAVLRFRRTGWDIPLIFFTVTLTGTVLLFVSPGIDSNHLIDLLVASLVLIALELSERHGGRGVLWGAGIFSGVIIATWFPGAPSVRHFLQMRGQPTVAAVHEIERRLPAGGTWHLLSENPIVPLTLGLRPEVMDCFSLRLSAARSPELRAKFFGDLDAQHYTAIILVDWSGAPLSQLPDEIARHRSLGAKSFYGEVHFPEGFLEALKRNYRLSFAVHPFVVFEPRNAVEVQP